MEDPKKQNRRLRGSYQDRRSGEDRRKTYSLDYFHNGGKERRSGEERRQAGERRKDCIRIDDWSSVCLKDSRS